ncbi:MAG TPA: DUF4956 domain-containing protein [Bacteroidia bacterium]|nr:DUF4956 domain-containing protein [Bacteroidia bacterium]
MTRTLLKFILPLFLLFTPITRMHAQTGGGSDAPTVTTSDQSQDDNSDDKKKKKKDDKKEDVKDDTDFFSISIDKFNPAFFARLGLDVLMMIILIRFVYFPVYQRRDHLFTFFMFNITIFIITFTLNTKSGFSTGAAFGMFAVFSLLRYRTENISARDMTYLFIVIALGLISSITKGNILETIVINSLIVVGAFLLDGNVFIKREFVKVVEYENVELIKPEKYQELLADLRSRTGLNVHKATVGRVDFLRDTATVRLYYTENQNQEQE